MRHPSEHFIKYLMIKDPGTSDAEIQKTLSDWGILNAPQSEGNGNYLELLRNDLEIPEDLQPHNRLHRQSMKYLRDQQVYELFYPTPGVEEAWNILADPHKRLMVEQILLARLDPKTAASKVNARMNWTLTGDGIRMFGHFFWNVKLLTFDEWGRYLYGRSAMYERHMALLQAPPQLAYFHLRVDQNLDSKRMIQRTQEIAYFTLEEIASKPGTDAAKVKAIGVLGKTVIECHNALATSDMALKDVLKEFEKFRMTHPEPEPKTIHQLAPAGNYSGSGSLEQKTEVAQAMKVPAKG